MNLPYLTAEFPGIGGVIKQRNEDFFVQELPLYEASGEGEHVYVELQKVGWTTFDLVNYLAKQLNVHPKDIGFAGMKDARAVTRQVFSIQGTTEDAVAALKIPHVQLMWARRHTNKLRLGHLSGNRFAIKIRDVEPTAVLKLRPVLDVLERRGVPNYFGEQRFGRRDNNDKLGAALVRGDNVAVLRELLGTPDPEIDDNATLQARQKFDARDNEGSMKAWPRRCGLERRVLARLMKTKKPNAAVRAIDEKLRRLWVSALQSRLFNDVLARRIGTIDRLMDGDLAYKHENGACFRVEKAEAEQPRADTFEVSPTGPLVGYRVTLPEGEPLAIEQAVFTESQLTPADFKQAGRERAKGARRPLRVKPTDVELASGVDEHGGHVTVAFTLPAGSFATVLLRELMKAPEPREEQSAGDDDADASGDDENSTASVHAEDGGDDDNGDGE